MGTYDKSSKWLIERHGDAILWLAGVRNIESWRPLPAEVVQPRELPDGLLEVRIQGEPEPRQFILELATYPERRLTEQLTGDALLVFLAHGRLPETVALVFHPKGQFQAERSTTVRSALGFTELSLRWRVIELWTLPAKELLNHGDPGIIPWVPLTQLDDPPEQVLAQCRQIIEAKALESERANLLAVTQVLTRLRFNDPELLKILGGHKVILESPLIQEIEARAEAAGKLQGKLEAKAESILLLLRSRFQTVPPELAQALLGIQEESRLDQLFQQALVCERLEQFRILPAP